MHLKTAMTRQIVVIVAAVTIVTGTAAADGGAAMSAREKIACVEACTKLSQELLRQRDREARSNREGTVSETEKPVFDIRTLGDTTALTDALLACIVRCREALR